MFVCRDVRVKGSRLGVGILLGSFALAWSIDWETAYNGQGLRALEVANCGRIRNLFCTEWAVLCFISSLSLLFLCLKAPNILVSQRKGYMYVLWPEL